MTEIWCKCSRINITYTVNNSTLLTYDVKTCYTHFFNTPLSFKSFLVRKEKEVSESVSADAVSELLIWFMKSEMMPVSVGKSSKHVYSYTKIKISSQTTITFVCCNSTGYFHRINLIFWFFFRLNCSLLPFCFRCYPRKQLGRGVEDLQLQSWLARFPPQIIPESLSCISLLFISFLSLCLSLFAINHIFRHLFNITSLHKFCLNFYTSLTFTSHLFSLDDLDWNPKLFQRKPGY